MRCREQLRAVMPAAPAEQLRKPSVSEIGVGRRCYAFHMIKAMSTESDSHEQSEEGVLCPKCLLANPPTAAFCSDCGAPIGMVSTIDPIQHIQAEGFAYRSAVDSPPKLIIVVGMWLLFAPIILVAPFLIFGGFPDSLPHTLFFTLLAVGSVILLYRTTRNYIVKVRSTHDRGA
jgi:hypothetical protein